MKKSKRYGYQGSYFKILRGRLQLKMMKNVACKFSNNKMVRSMWMVSSVKILTYMKEVRTLY